MEIVKDIEAVDLLCGGGGASEGMKQAGWKVVACLNHSEVAIDSHQVNFPQALHLRADLRAAWHKSNPKADIVWISPACTFHSIANGGDATDEQSRAHAEEAMRYGVETNASCILVENVKEFPQWGPTEDKLDRHGKPVYKRNKETGELERVRVAIKKRKGEYYNQWLKAMKDTGYVNYECKLLDAADYGVPQRRIRYFGIFTRLGVPIRWPQPTHGKDGVHGLLPWRPVRECLDLSKKGRSVFNRTKTSKKGTRPDPLSDKTLRRIIAGLRKFVFGQQFLTHYYSGGGQLSSLDTVLPTLTTNPHARLITPEPMHFLHKRTSNPPSGKPGKGADIDLPAPTLATCFQPDLVTVQPFVHTYYGNGSVRTLNEPCPTIPTKDRVGLCQPEGFLFSHVHTNEPWSLEQPTRTIVASRRHQYVVQILRGCPQLQPQPGDSITMRLLKALCRRFGIADIFMRMLYVPELKLIMGFRSDYHLGGSATEQKEMLGNAVCPAVARALAVAMTPSVLKARKLPLPALRISSVVRWEQGNLFAA
ncbi:DNA cytosine methyltransferase [Hymenobacter sp. UYP22]|uniref:DNA cytosine methyltransferase n=1 Tax=Hymenobacter sp. UYP22 TaxID=3156348 RepID=UPI003394DF38